MKQCELCGRYANTERHHVFNSANRKHSEKYGLVANLCPECHRFGKDAVHVNAAVSLELKQRYQRIFEADHSRAEFLKIMGRNYL